MLSCLGYVCMKCDTAGEPRSVLMLRGAVMKHKFMDNVVLQLGLAFILFSIFNPFLTALSVTIFPPEPTIFFNPDNLMAPGEIIARRFRAISPEQYIGVALVLVGGVIVVVSNNKKAKGNTAPRRSPRTFAPQQSDSVFCSSCGVRCEFSAEYCRNCGNRL